MPIVDFDFRDDPMGWGRLIVAQLSDGATIDRPVALRLARRLLAAGGRAAVWYSADDPWAIVGFALGRAEGNVVLWAWTRPVNRGPKTSVMTKLLTHIGIDLAKVVNCVFRSPAAEGIARRGKIRLEFLDHERGSNAKER